MVWASQSVTAQYAWSASPTDIVPDVIHSKWNESTWLDIGILIYIGCHSAYIWGMSQNHSISGTSPLLIIRT